MVCLTLFLVRFLSIASCILHLPQIILSARSSIMSDDVAASLPARIESDSMGELSVPARSLWGAQTQRSLQNFPIGTDLMPLPVIYGMATVKKCCALYHSEIGVMDKAVANAIARAADEISAGSLDRHFPLKIYQVNGVLG
jgi:aspartate ammonia-lyase